MSSLRSLALALMAGGLAGVVAVLAGFPYHHLAAALTTLSVYAALEVRQLALRRLRRAQRAPLCSVCERRPGRWVVVSVTTGRTFRTCERVACMITGDERLHR